MYVVESKLTQSVRDASMFGCFRRILTISFWPCSAAPISAVDPSVSFKGPHNPCEYLPCTHLDVNVSARIQKQIGGLNSTVRWGEHQGCLSVLKTGVVGHGNFETKNAPKNLQRLRIDVAHLEETLNDGNLGFIFQLTECPEHYGRVSGLVHLVHSAHLRVEKHAYNIVVLVWNGVVLKLLVRYCSK